MLEKQFLHFQGVLDLDHKQIASVASGNDRCDHLSITDHLGDHQDEFEDVIKASYLQ